MGGGDREWPKLSLTQSLAVLWHDIFLRSIQLMNTLDLLAKCHQANGDFKSAAYTLSSFKFDDYKSVVNDGDVTLLEAEATCIYIAVTQILYALFLFHFSTFSLASFSLLL